MTRGFAIISIVDAAPARVFQAWTDVAHLGWFFSEPDSPPTEPIVVDLRVGGAWRQLMVIDDTTEYVTGGVYREIITDEKLVFAWGAIDGWPEFEVDYPDGGPLVTVTFTPIGTQTELVFVLSFADSVSDERVDEWLATGMHQGWSQTLERLVAVYD